MSKRYNKERQQAMIKKLSKDSRHILMKQKQDLKQQYIEERQREHLGQL